MPLLSNPKLKNTAWYAISVTGMFFLSFSIFKAYTPPDALALIQKVGDLMKPMQKMMDRMEKIETGESFDVDFAAMMAEHHQGAINMTAVFLESGKDDKLKEMSRTVMEKQKEELKVLREFIDQSKVVKLSMTTGKDQLMQIMHGAMAEMQQIKISGDTDKDFATLMIIHHQSGMDMAILQVSSGRNPNIQDMAARMAGDQEREMNELKKWLGSRK